jgi:hypothetical protein
VECDTGDAVALRDTWALTQAGGRVMLTGQLALIVAALFAGAAVCSGLHQKLPEPPHASFLVLPSQAASRGSHSGVTFSARGPFSAWPTSKLTA